MAIYTGRNMPKEVGRTTMDSDVKDWLKDGPSLAHTNQYMSNAQRTIGLSTPTNRRSARSNISASTVRTAQSRFAAFIRRSPV